MSSPGFCEADFLRSFMDLAGYPLFHAIKAFLNKILSPFVRKNSRFFFKEGTCTSKHLWTFFYLFIYLFIYLSLFVLLPHLHLPWPKTCSEFIGIHLRRWQMGQVGFHDADGQTSRLGRNQRQVEGAVS